MRRVGLVVGIVLLIGCTRDKSAVERFAESVQHGSRMAPAISILRVDSLRASQRYYRDVLGFATPWEDGDPPDFGAVQRDDATIFLCQRCQGSPGTWLTIFAPNVDRLYEEVKAKGATIRMPPTTMPWHLRELHVSDPDGHVIRFSSHTKH